MKQTQAMANHYTMVQPSPAPYYIERKPTKSDIEAARHSTAVRRAIEEYQEQRAQRREMEL